MCDLFCGKNVVDINANKLVEMEELENKFSASWSVLVIVRFV